MKKHNIIKLVLAAFIIWLVACGNNGSNIKGPNQEEQITVIPKILFKTGAVLASPDAVDSIRITIFFNGESRIKTFSFVDRQGSLSGIPANTPFRLRIEGLDTYRRVIYSGENEYPGATANISVTITANEVTPKAPTDLRLEPLSASSIRLTWNDNSSNENGFILQRSLSDTNNFITIDSVGSSFGASISRIDSTGLTPLTVYYYRLCAFNGAGASLYLTPQATVTTGSSVNIDTTKPTLNLNTIPDTVKVPQITLSGKAFDKSGISKLLINSAEVTVGSTDSTFAYLVSLTEGQNNIVLKLSDNSANRNETVLTVSVVYNPTATDNTPPVLKIVSPLDSATIASATIVVYGTADDPGSGISSLKLGVTDVTRDGINWSISVTLKSGWNTLYFTAIDNSSNTVRDTLYLFSDTTKPDNTPPVINFGSLSENHIFTDESTTVAIKVLETGSGVDTVTINGVVASLIGTSWSARVGLQSDTNMLRVMAKDKAGNRTSDSLKVILNRYPNFRTTRGELEGKNPIPVQTTYFGQLIVDDLDGQTVFLFTKISGPSSLQVDPKNGKMTWLNPAAGIDAACSVVVTDKHGFKDTLAWRFYTTQDQTPPTIMLSSPRNNDIVNVSPVLVQISAYDNESGIDIVMINMRQATQISGLWQLSVNLNGGLNKIALYAKDKKGNEKYDTLSVILNRAPVFTSTETALTKTITVGTAYSNTVVASDPDGHSLTYRKLVSPSGLTLDSVSGAVFWTPTKAESVWVSVEANDSYGGKDTVSWSIFAEPVAWTTFGDTSITNGFAANYSMVIAPDSNNIYVCVTDANTGNKSSIWKSNVLLANWKRDPPSTTTDAFSHVSLALKENTPGFFATLSNSSDSAMKAYVLPSMSKIGLTDIRNLTKPYACYRANNNQYIVSRIKDSNNVVVHLYSSSNWTTNTPSQFTGKKMSAMAFALDYETQDIVVVASDSIKKELYLNLWYNNGQWSPKPTISLNTFKSQLHDISATYDMRGNYVYVIYLQKNQDSTLGLLTLKNWSPNLGDDGGFTEKGCSYPAVEYHNDYLYVAYINQRKCVSVVYKKVTIPGSAWRQLGDTDLTKPLSWLSTTPNFKLAFAIDHKNGAIFLGFPDPNANRKMRILKGMTK